MSEKSLKKLRNEYENKLRNACYSHQIVAECHFNIKQKIRYENRENSLLQLSKDKAPINVVNYKRYISVSENTFAIGTKRIYPELIELTSSIKVKKKNFADTINDSLGVCLGEKCEVPSRSKYVTSISKETQQQILNKLNELEGKIENISVDTMKNNINSKLKKPYIRLKVDQEGYFDSIATTREFKLTSNEQRLKYTGFFSGSTVIAPSISAFLDYLHDVYYSNWYRHGEKFINSELYDILNGDIFTLIDNKKNEVLTEIKSVRSKVENLYKKYDTLEEKITKMFSETKNKSGNKDKIANAYKKLIDKYGESKAKKKLREILRQTGSKLSVSDVVSLYKKKYKPSGDTGDDKQKKPKDTEKTKKPKDDGNSGSGNTSNTSNTGAKVGKKRNIKNTIASAAAIVSNKKYDKNIKAIRDAGKSKITEIKNAASTKMENASKVAMDKKNTALIEKNNSIQDINKEAMEKINKIDINDPDAASKIAEIKSDAASKIALAEEKYNNTIKQIDNAKSAEVATIKADLNNKVGRVNQLVSDQVKSLKNSEKSAGVAGVTTAIKSINSKDVASYKMNVTADAVTTSNTNASTSNDSLTSLINEKLKVLNNNSNNVSPSQPSSSESVATEVTPAQNVTQPSSDTSATTATTTSSNYSNNNSSSNVVSDANSVSSNSNVTDSVDSSDNVGSSTSSTTSSSSSTDSSISDVIKPKKVITDITADDSSSSSSVSSSNGGSSKAVIPAVLGVGAVGAAAVAGVRYVKGRKQNEDIDDSYDDENNNIDQSDDSVYGDDVYSGPAGSEYTDISEFATDDEGNSDSLETNEYIDADYLNSDSSDDDFSDDEVMKELNRE